jgi:hypothetical protein
MDEKDNVKGLEGSTIGAPRYIIPLFSLIIVLIAILSLVGFHIIGEYEISEGYELFRDILATILAIAGLAIAILGYGIYQFILENVSSRVEREMKEWKNVVDSRLKKIEDKGEFFSNALVSLNIGFTYWLTYKDTNQKQPLYTAIDLTEIAYNDVIRLDESEPENEKLKCQVMNNLGYYLAERGNPEDREFAIKCAEFIKEKIDKYPDKRKLWQDTYDYIIKKYRN